MITFVLTVVFDLVIAIEIGMLLAVLLFMKRMSEESGVMGWKYYDPDEVVMGKTMREQLKFALSWWHTMGGDGTDMFGVGTADKTWGETDPEARAQLSTMLEKAYGMTLDEYTEMVNEEIRVLIPEGTPNFQSE